MDISTRHARLTTLATKLLQEISPRIGGDHYKFTGDEHDSESNLEHTMYRQLSGVQGRWLSPDPYMASMELINPQSLNRYTYVGNNPTVALDPSGLNRCKAESDTGQDCTNMVIADVSTFSSQYDGSWWSGGTTCTINGMDAGCGSVMRQIGAGVAGQCPENNCQGVVLRDIGGGYASFYKPSPGLSLNCRDYSGDAQNQCNWSSNSLAWLADSPMGTLGQGIFHGPGMQRLWAQSSMTANAAAIATPAVPAAAFLVGEVATSSAGDYLFARGTGQFNSNNYIRVGWAWARTSLLDSPYGGVTYFGIRLLNWHLNGPIWSYPGR